MSHLKKIAAAGLTLTTIVSMFPMTAMAATKNGWVQNSSGKWSYYEDGEKVKYDSREDYTDGKCYVLSSAGYRYTKKGLYTSSYIYTRYGDKVKFKQSYYIQDDGSVLEYSWKKISGKWYYFGYRGKMYKSTTEYKYDEKTGTGKYYLLGNDGAMITKKGWNKVTHKEYSTWSVNLYKETRYYYVLSDGSVARDCVKKIKGKYYAFEYDGLMVQNSGYSVNGKKKYLYGSDGSRITKKGWIKLTVTSTYKGANYSYTSKLKQWFYVNKDGTVATGWKKISGKWYYFDSYSGKMYRSTENSWIDEGKTYIFNSDGVCINH